VTSCRYIYLPRLVPSLPDHPLFAGHRQEADADLYLEVAAEFLAAAIE
jgi:hypothetical protein